MNRILFLLVLFVVSYNIFAQGREKKVLIIGIDGCRPDVLKEAQTPAINKLIGNGAYSFSAKTDPISSSGICWTGMLTGVWHEKHNVVSNSYKNPNIGEYPHLFRRIKEFNPELKTYSIVNWNPIHKILQKGEADIEESYSPDRKVTKRVVEVLSKEDPDVVFVQLDDVDHAGHTYDYLFESPKYVKAIQKADKQIGKMVQTIAKRNTIKNEDWLIIVSTDHGGSNFTHGKDIPEHTTIFYIASGNATQKGEIDDVNVVDVCVTTLAHMGVKIAPEWNLDGKVRGLIEY
ncbi:alkaline phosphatase family protein [Draconibacterium sediminis]|uniref:alkaline phosphatase family protein n=1 Tax=Draconibacterium sediminis TaxID=1544798 RepID=UPI0005D44E05|nr:alkaline phosphatase family protein [Draconibacterium sediminis]